MEEMKMASFKPEEKMPEIRWPEIEKADNGYVVKWSEREKKPEGSMEHCEYINRTLLFSGEEKEKAWDKFKELKMIEIDNKRERY